MRHAVEAPAVLARDQIDVEPDLPDVLAARAGVSPTTALNLEAGKAKPQRRTIRKLVEALGVEPSELVE
jgi:transcriptional regulator with XRE-family HTH domain